MDRFPAMSVALIGDILGGISLFALGYMALWIPYLFDLSEPNEQRPASHEVRAQR